MNSFLSKKFAPFYGTMFLGAFNDNTFRYAISVMIAYQMGFSEQKATALSNLLMALMMLPQFFLSAMAGACADKFGQRKLFTCIKLTETCLMVVSLIAFGTKCLPFLFLMLFLSGTQSAFFSPPKYAYPRRNVPDELVRANAFISAGTYVAILCGMIAGTFLIELPNGNYWTGVALLLVAATELGLTRLIPDIPAANPEMKLDLNPVTTTWKTLCNALKNPNVRVCVIGMSLFWTSGALYATQLTVFCKEVLGANAYTVTVLTLLFSIGVALGSLICAVCRKLFPICKGITPALILMAWFTFDIFFAAKGWTKIDPNRLVSIVDLIQVPAFWRFVADLVLLAACGGFYTVPLSAMMQKFASEDELARVVAGNNILNTFMIVCGAGLISILSKLDLVSVSSVFVVIGFMNIAAGIYLFRTRNMNPD